MPREYRHIKDYEKEIEELRKEGFSSREIGIKFGFSYKQMRNYFYRHNVEQRKREKSLQSCNSTVTKAFSIHPMRTLS